MNLDKRTLKVLKKIYHSPYITVAEIKLLFPYPDIDELLDWLEMEKYISARIADTPETDEGYESRIYEPDAHLLSIRKGNMAAEDQTLLRANVALVIAILSLFVSILALIFH